MRLGLVSRDHNQGAINIERKPEPEISPPTSVNQPRTPQFSRSPLTIVCL